MKPIIIKVGGALLDCDVGIERLFTTLVELKQADWQPVLVHGGGLLVDQHLTAHGFTTSKHQGLRVTPAEQIPVVAAALAGGANSTLVAAAIAAGLTPVGLSLADGGMTTAVQMNEVLGMVGEVEPANAALPENLLALGMMPIICSIAVNNNGQRLNVNADQAATALCQLLKAPLVLLSDVSGVLDGKGKLIPNLGPELAATLIEQGIIEGGMQVKVDSALAAAKAINNRVLVASWRYPEQLAGLVRGEPVGTVVEA
ncbi:acetylglutamate kinase [Ferrimonas lipolytica]|uniref:Acetylglutamate kinase n=1 Tax=Ferrimonas lipolytica TaxID=2724191 RepID=A0A6H1UIP4_9GAMM|nr:acetylglutamate kinase [Ferrimonas lipolytica]QIZ78499.1 acetylglutamate kinase [Ferrimonas lipolytica]